MGKKRENQRVIKDKCTVFSSTEHLVGYSGKVSFKKLKPLKRSRTDKIREKSLEQDYLDRCNGLSLCLKGHRNLLELLYTMTCCNGNEFCGSNLCQELQERHATNATLIKLFLEQLGYTEDGKTKKAISQKEEITLKEQFFQMFVHGVKPGQPLVLMVKQDEKGLALKHAVLKKCPRMEKESDSPQREEMRSNGPQGWNKDRVIKWIDEICDEYEIDPNDVSNLKTLSGRGLMKLKREDWIGRSPKQGDLLYNLWQELPKTSAMMKNGENIKKSPPISPRKGSAKREAEILHQNKPVVEELNLKEKGLLPVGDQPHSSLVAPGTLHSQTSASNLVSEQGPFGTVEYLEKTENYLTIDELAKRYPANKELVTIKGICSSRPHNAGGAGSVLLRNDPDEGKESLQLKVDIRSQPGYVHLTKNAIKTILRMKVGEQLFVKGRIEHEKDPRPDSRRLRFVVIVDCESHAAFREEIKEERSSKRQTSIPWSVELGLYPAEGCAQEPLYLNNRLEISYGILALPSDASDEKIKECVVALKNSATGDIFVGVNDNGIVVGSKVSRDAIKQKRDHLVRILGGVLPCTNDSVSISTSAVQTRELVENEEDFVAAMCLQSETPSLENVQANEDVPIIFRLHVVKGTSAVHFAKPADTNAFVRVGTETKMVTDYNDLFSRLESLASRNIPEKSSTSINQEVDKASSNEPTEKSEKSYSLLKKHAFETERNEFKVIYGEPMEIILKHYIKKYADSFLNSGEGDIHFGIYEEQKTKNCYVVGVSLPLPNRKLLLRESSKIICNFWPPVNSDQFFMKFIEVKWDWSKNLLKYPKTYGQWASGFVAVCFQNNKDVPKLVNWVRNHNLFSLFLMEGNRFGLLAKDVTKMNVEDFLSKMEEESKKSKYFKMDMVSKEVVEATLKDLCVVNLHVRASPYPVHLTSPLHTHCLDSQGVVSKMKPNQLLERFTRRDHQYDPEKLLNAANRFEKQNTSYLLICSPLSLPKTARDLYGLVVPEWALVLDFDQAPNQEGHLLNLFKPLHDHHQVERNLSVKTPLDRRLDLNPRNGVCWCAVRGYEDIGNTLSEQGHASWMKSHGHKTRALIDQLIVHINPNQLVVVCMWNDGHEILMPSLYMLLEHLFSSWGPTKVIFVCSNYSFKVFSDVITSRASQQS
ncbi:hypothetical protein P5673_006462 [Acropora cervicornis]|uniref:PNT domain-containing protein n=1 Tax=Acropora cervicornis TaxID=6130 RepID=A0AAD9QW01_ACRCE|nr:hypothetical protein P5673_006462 [Acropora cervicornis]